ncbi:hypothetical protein MIB43_017115 [Providencia rettgeri]|uniref:hypothetical protein n=1 Tax=Providencia rettgeri TaxID=587 RepID=UPI001F033DEE|nr:hypothetical protein [Providencia rettgeri]MCG9951633.1 hypothetical protein [Providencia rettgeri]
MDITITAENQSVISKFMSADLVSKELTDLGLTVLDTSIRDGKALIQVARHDYCDSLIQQGKASYVYVQGIKYGIFKLGQCRVCWTESIH